MANYTVLKAAIEDVIKTNGNNEITGQLLQDTLIAMINSLGVGYQFAGVAIPSTNPGTPDQNVFYIAGPGTYINFGSTVVPNGAVGVFTYNGTWGYTVKQVELPDFVNVNELLGQDIPFASATDARVAIPQQNRKAGLNITYMLSNDAYKWVTEQFIGDDVDDWTDADKWQAIGPVNNTNSANTKAISHILTLLPFETIDNKIMSSSGTEVSNTSFKYRKYNCIGNRLYLFSAHYPNVQINAYILFWFDIDGNLIRYEPYKGIPDDEVTIVQQPVMSPANAVYAYLNVLKSTESGFELYQMDVLKSDNINTQAMQTKADVSMLLTQTPIATVTGKYIASTGSEIVNSDFSYKKYSVNGGDIYTFSGKFVSAINIIMLVWADANNKLISIEYKGIAGQVDDIKNKAVIAPSNAAYAYLNIYNLYKDNFNFCTIGDTLNNRDLLDDIKDVEDITREINTLTPSSSIDNTFFKSTGATGSNSYTRLDIYDVIPGNRYCFSGEFGPTFSIRYIAWADESNNFIYAESYVGPNTTFVDQEVNAPDNAHYAWLNVVKATSNEFALKAIGEPIKSQDLRDDIDEMKDQIELLTKYDTKVVIPSFEGALEEQLFYLRAKYNDDKDIIITHRTNLNGLISFEKTYIGAKNLADAEIMVDANLVSTHTDSTAPLFSVTTDCPYWHTYAQHGYPIPTITNNASLDASDVNAEWKDQLDRHYKIGKVTSNLIYLLPVIYVSDGHNTRDWKSVSQSSAITSLTYVSGGSSGHHTSPITVSGYAQIQLRPIMEHDNRIYTIDGKIITEPGTYYCNEFSVSESQIGYDPATISDWFGGADGNPVLTGADITAKFTFSYNYRGAQCCMNTTIAIFKAVICDSYGAIQQQFFFDKGDYMAMFMIPKAKMRNGIELDKPFNSPSSPSPTYSFYRTTDDLKDIDNLIDRQIGYLYKSDGNDYLVGMAAGLSLVSGDTVNTKRLAMIPQGAANAHYLLHTFSPANTNKFYIAAFNTAPYESNGYYLPTTFFKEINCYVSYFDPAENVGQVYWYKDGKSYVIYAHCQSIQSRVPINVPGFMEGLKLSVVEKTTNAELLTDTIQNGKFFVNYNTDDANYIVLKTE